MQHRGSGICKWTLTDQFGKSLVQPRETFFGQALEIRNAVSGYNPHRYILLVQNGTGHVGREQTVYSGLQRY